MAEELEVIINGVRYAPEGAPPKPNAVSVWYMHDGHWFTRIKETSVDAIIEKAREIERESPYGMLCDVSVFWNDKELGRVGKCAHSGGKYAPDKWERELAVWKEKLLEHPDVVALIEKGAWWKNE